MLLSTQAKYGKELDSSLELSFQFLKKSGHSSPTKYPTLDNGDHVPNNLIPMFTKLTRLAR